MLWYNQLYYSSLCARTKPPKKSKLNLLAVVKYMHCKSLTLNYSHFTTCERKKALPKAQETRYSDSEWLYGPCISTFKDTQIEGIDHPLWSHLRVWIHWLDSNRWLLDSTSLVPDCRNSWSKKHGNFHYKSRCDNAFWKPFPDTLKSHNHFPGRSKARIGSLNDGNGAVKWHTFPVS